MRQITQLTTVASIYTDDNGIKQETTSSRVFNDSKKLAALNAGGDITVSRWTNAMQWFSDNWPDGAKWPADIERPEQAVPAE